MNNVQRFFTNKGSKGKPLRTTAELAEEFGISTRSLAAFLRSSKVKPMLADRKLCTVKNTWYDPDEVRVWWKAKETK